MGDVPDIRVGHAERERAIAALNEHFSAGRLTLTEYDDRSARAVAATTRGDLDALFADLPLLPTRVGPAPPPAQQHPQIGKPSGRELPRGPIMALMPFVALTLFIVTDFQNNWLFFLLIPVTAILLFGFGSSDDNSGKC
ncbi:DUF1707 SHOCT-like domain-containing protein [Hoyosella subflava]|nr:DUF1707 domain-containing protein [Hoyosella subflava]